MPAALSGISIRKAAEADLPQWAIMRAQLWSDATAAQHGEELAGLLAGDDADKVAFIAAGPDGRLCGFAEAALRRDYVNGCDTSPVAFLEGIYVCPDARRAAVARLLVAEVEAWGRGKGCGELASDADLHNEPSHAFHRAAGFEETERVVYFRKLL